MRLDDLKVGDTISNGRWFYLVLSRDDESDGSFVKLKLLLLDTGYVFSADYQRHMNRPDLVRLSSAVR